MAGRSLVKFDFTLTDFVDGARFTPKEKKRVLADIADLILKEVVANAASGRSPVTGTKFQKLSPEYAKEKKKEGGTILAGNGSNLELSGKYLSAHEVVKTDRGLRLTVRSSEQPKADGHNNFSGDSKLPERKTIPNAELGEFFSSDIVTKAKQVIEDALG